MSNGPENAAAGGAERAKANTGKKRVDLITGILLLLFAIFMIFQGLDMKIMDQYSPGAGMFPMGVGIVLAVLSLSLAADSLNPKKPDKASKFQNRAGILNAFKMIVGLLVYVALLQKLGYLIMTMALVLYIMKVVEKASLKISLIVAVCVTLMLFLIFQVGLQVTLPKSPFGF